MTHTIARIECDRQAANSLLCWETSEEMAPTAMSALCQKKTPSNRPDDEAPLFWCEWGVRSTPRRTITLEAVSQANLQPIIEILIEIDLTAGHKVHFAIGFEVVAQLSLQANFAAELGGLIAIGWHE